MPENLAKAAEGASELLASIPGSPVWASRYVDANNNTTDPITGHTTNNLAPNLIPGLWGKDSEMGREYDRDKNNGKIIPQFPASLISGTKANPILKGINHLFPGGKSGTDYHDAAMPKNASKMYKATSIAPYFLLNYYGAAGTLIDTPNYNKNFLPNKNIK